MVRFGGSRTFWAALEKSLEENACSDFFPLLFLGIFFFPRKICLLCFIPIFPGVLGFFFSRRKCLLLFLVPIFPRICTFFLGKIMLSVFFFLFFLECIFLGFIFVFVFLGENAFSYLFFLEYVFFFF